MVKVTHIITGLGSGGAENMLYKLLKYSDRKKYDHEVISLMDKGVYGLKIEQMGIKVYCLNLSKINVVKSISKARKIVRNRDIVNTWLYHADLFGFVIAKVFLRKKLIWNIRHSNLDKDVNKPRTLMIVKLNSFLSKYVDSITYNSSRALETHAKTGYLNLNSIIIPNGFELDKFKYNQSDRLKIRNKLMINEFEKMIITVGRWNIQKDYITLLKSINELKGTKFKMIMVGTDLDYSNKELVDLIKHYNLTGKIILLGRRDDIPALLSAADIYISSSLGESFSNSIGEAMACELSCVVTDVGDSRIMVGDTGIVVQAKDYIRMGEALFVYLKNDGLERNVNARDRVIRNYEIQEISKIFERNYQRIS